MQKEDLKIANKLKKKIKKYPEFKFFIARKTGGNAKGLGTDRSVILARYDNVSQWFQFAKIWGDNNEQRAKDIINLIYMKKVCWQCGKTYDEWGDGYNFCDGCKSCEYWIPKDKWRKNMTRQEAEEHRTN